MKLALAIALNLAILATAAPASLHGKRADGQEVSPDADLTSSIGYNALKSATEMIHLNMDDEDDNKASEEKDADFGNNMTPNDMTSFPAADGSGPDKPTVKRPLAPTPTRDDEEDDENKDKDGADKDKDDEDEESRPTPSSSAAAASSSKPSAEEDSEGESEERGMNDSKKKKKKPAAEEPEAPEASPKASGKPEKPKENNDPLSNLPVIGGLTKGILGGGGL